eukprot:761663-Hanusia_phi.AAC.3
MEVREGERERRTGQTAEEVGGKERDSREAGKVGSGRMGKGEVTPCMHAIFRTWKVGRGTHPYLLKEANGTWRGAGSYFRVAPVILTVRRTGHCKLTSLSGPGTATAVQSILNVG